MIIFYDDNMQYIVSYYEFLLRSPVKKLIRDGVPICNERKKHIYMYF